MRVDRFPLRALALVATLAISATSPLAAQGRGHAYGRVGKAVTQHRGDDGWRRDRDDDHRRWNRDRDEDRRRWDRDRDDRGRYRDSRATWDRDRRAAERRAAERRRLELARRYDRRDAELQRRAERRWREEQLRRERDRRGPYANNDGRVRSGACNVRLPDGRAARVVRIGQWKTVRVPC